MIKSYRYKGYILTWSDGGEKDGFGGYWLRNTKSGELECHATTTDEPLTEQQAKEAIEAHIELRKRGII